MAFDTGVKNSLAAAVLADEADGIRVSSTFEEASIFLDAREHSSVKLAAGNLKRDLSEVTGGSVVEAESVSKAKIVIGTYGVSNVVQSAVESGVLDISALKDENGSLRWESYLIQAHEDKLYVVGASNRGTIFAIYSIAQAVGVSPWNWWADVPTKHHSSIVFDSQTHFVDWPSVKYRGVFINDEEELYDWARLHTNDDGIGPETYRRFFELVLRLKGNYVWPAMHVGAFADDPENGRIADEMGIVVGTTHCDMLMRSNQHEWDPWMKNQGEEVKYDYSLPGHNREMIQKYWREGVDRNRGYEVTWTVGIRGIHDTGFVTRAIDNDKHLSEEQKHRARVDLLSQVIKDQRQILKEELGDGGEKAPQIFVPYKEVLPLYDDGLELPDDVTILWASDNYGYVRRFPSLEEQKRSGGHGLYYHSSYWAPTDSYLATSSTPLTLMKNELSKSWDNGIRQLWIDNIGGLKPMEQEMEYFLHLAWTAGTSQYEQDVEEYVARWFDRNFSGGFGGEAARIYTEYYQLTNERKPENLEEGVFSQNAYGDESGEHVRRLRNLYKRTNTLLKALPDVEHDAFFEMFAVKIHFSYLVNAQFDEAARSKKYARLGSPVSGEKHLLASRGYEMQKRALVEYYNKGIADGKWNLMFTPDDFPPPATAQNPAATPALRVAKSSELKVLPWGESEIPEHPSLTFDSFGTDTKWIEILSTGLEAIHYKVKTSDEWVETGAREGQVSGDSKISVKVDFSSITATSNAVITIVDLDHGNDYPIVVKAVVSQPVADDFSGSLESDGHISIDPNVSPSLQNNESTRWLPIAHLGRFGNAAVQTSKDSDSQNSALTFNIWVETPGAHQLEVHRIPSLSSTGLLRIGVCVDGGPVAVLESPTTDERRGNWEVSKLDNIERLRMRLPYIVAGPHTLTLIAIDPYFAIDKLVIYTDEWKYSNLGPVFSRMSGTGVNVQTQAAFSEEDGALSELIGDRKEIYHLEDSQVPLPKIGFIDANYWNTDTTFKRYPSVRQSKLGAPKYAVGGSQDYDLTTLIDSEVPTEVGGRIAFEAEMVLNENSVAWSSPSLNNDGEWVVTQAETDGQTGFAMRATNPYKVWSPTQAPSLNYSINVGKGGRYHVWLLAQFDARGQDLCYLSLDGVPKDSSENFSKGGLWAFGNRYVWHWTELTDVDLTQGSHLLSFLAGNGGLRIDRVYLTLGNELPPLDDAWKTSSK